MPAVYGRNAKITNAVGRSDYLTDDKRQEEIVLHKSMMTYSWEQHSAFEAAHQRTDKENNEAREVHFALPNELSDNPDELEKICDEIAAAIVGTGHDMEYAVHWNKARTNLHCHVLFSERENVSELVPKVYKKDIWQDRETHKLAKAGAENAELVHRKGEVQRDKDGNIKYNSDIFTAKDTRFTSRRWIHEKNEAIQSVLKEHGFDLDLTTKDSPYLAQKKLYKGASEDYLAAAEAWNEAARDYNKDVRETLAVQPDALPQLCEQKKQLVARTRVVNRPEKRITARAVELIKTAAQRIRELFREPEMKEIKVKVPWTNFEDMTGIPMVEWNGKSILFSNEEYHRVDDGWNVEITLNGERLYRVMTSGGLVRQNAEELRDTLAAELTPMEPTEKQRETQRAMQQRQRDDDFEL